MSARRKNTQAWQKLDSVAKHIELAAKVVGDQAREDFALSCDIELDPVTMSYIAETIESPLQAIFWVWFEAEVKCDIMTVASEDWELPDLDPEREVTCSSGEKYRLDFAVTLKDPAPLIVRSDLGFREFKIAVELDGHDFHERTPEQVALRNRRDDDLAHDGWRVLHFSGQEIHRHPRGCAQRVIDAFRSIESDWFIALALEAGRRNYVCQDSSLERRFKLMRVAVARQATS